MPFFYLSALVIALACMVVLDHRFRLFFWRDARRASIVMVVGLAFFLGWDLAGIDLGIFFRGETNFMTGLQLAPELPLEEPFFLVLLCYLAMNLYGYFAGRAAGGTPAGRVASAGTAPAGRVASASTAPAGRVASASTAPAGRVASASERIETGTAQGLDTAARSSRPTRPADEETLPTRPADDEPEPPHPPGNPT